MPKIKTATNVQDKMAINNAGLVLLTSYMSLLFDRLGLLNEGMFIDGESQLRAVHYLQFIASGHSNTEESFLTLNKLLCGLDITDPVYEGIDISEEEKTLIEGLLSAAIGHWPAIGNSSIEGFRGNWLIRDGLLHEEEEHWQLHVEKKPYDLLIQKSPYSFSIIKHAWMPKPLKVTWPY